MGIVIGGMTMSLDGYINDPNGSVSKLYPDLAALGETDMLQDSIRRVGAVVMGRHTYDMANGDFTGYEFQSPLFIVTHDAPHTTAKGANDKLSFTFVTDGVESAIRQAKAAARERDVTIVGGATMIQQCINAGLIDELQIGVMPVFLGGGQRLFDRIHPRDLEFVKVIPSLGGRVDLVYHFVK